MTYKYLVLFCWALCLAGCAHNPPVKAGGAMQGAALSRAAQREELPPTAGKRPAVKAREKDDFIEVDDKNGFVKSWPMALCLGLVAAAACIF